MKRVRLLILIFVPVGVIAAAMVLFMTGERVPDEEVSKKDRSALKSLPYLAWSTLGRADLQKIGVTLQEPDRYYEGLNIYTHYEQSTCDLMDMSGTVLHTWSGPKGNWHEAELLRNGDLLVIDRNRMLLRLDWESNMRWTSERNYHHDVDVADNGDIYALAWDVLQIPYGSETIPIVDDRVVILTPGGSVKKEVSIFGLFGSEVTAEERGEIREHLRSARAAGEEVELGPLTVFDVFHTNTLDIVETEIEGVARRGDVLICIRNLDIVAVIDVFSNQVVWRLDRHDLEMPHQPSFVDGNLLIFDNGAERGYSRVIEIDPHTSETIWEYTGDPKEAFFSCLRGGCQRLPNGNTLIVESDRAHVFEVTKEGETVWEFYGTDMKRALRRRRPIYRMTRVASEFVDLNAVRPR